jgi:ADP-ribosylglycohydrolase
LRKYKKLPDEDELVYNVQENMSGNGSLMRLCPVPLLFLKSSPLQVAEMAKATSLPTHASPLCISSCALFALYIHHLVHSTLPTAKERKLAVLNPDFDLLGGATKPSFHLNEKTEAIRKGDGWRGVDREEVRTSGFVIHTLEAALWALDSFDSFEEGMMALLKMGEDVDTVSSLLHDRYRHPILSHLSLRCVAFMGRLLALAMDLKACPPGGSMDWRRRRCWMSSQTGC